MRTCTRKLSARASGCARCDDTALDPSAYASLLGFYLGDGCISTAARYFFLRVTCDLAYPAIVHDVSDCIRAVHPGGNVYRVVAEGCVNWTRRRVAGQWKRYDYPRWQFSNRSTDIRELCCWALDLADIPWRQSHAWTISVSTRAGVARLDELVGPKS